LIHFIIREPIEREPIEETRFRQITLSTVFDNFAQHPLKVLLCLIVLE
jgi:hypothetical protein